MENIFTAITEILGSVKAIDWAAFFLFWLSVERVLKAIATVTPWKWDDDLVASISRAINGFKKS